MTPPPRCLARLRRFRLIRRPARDVGAALRQHVGIAAGIFDPAAVALRHDHGVHHPVEEVAVVADQQDRAGIIGQHFLQQVQRFQVEIVGRLVQHQQVGGLAPATGPASAAPRSPPDSTRTGVRACSGENRKSFM